MIVGLSVWIDLSVVDAGPGRTFWTEAAGPGADLSPRISVGGVATTRARLVLAVAGPDPGPPGDRVSPAGFAFTIDRPGTGSTAGVASGSIGAWPDGHRSRIDQLTIDVTSRAWQAEVAFWRDLTGWAVGGGSAAEFVRVHTPPRLPVRLLLQRRRRGPTSAHLDISCDDRGAEVARMEALGATRVGEGVRWTVLQPPVGPPVCVTDRDPATGLLHGSTRSTRGGAGQAARSDVAEDPTTRPSRRWPGVPSRFDSPIW